MAEGLNLEWKYSLNSDWLGIAVRGEDAEAFASLIRREFGEAPVHFSKVEKWDVRKGFVTGAGRIGYGVYIDLGILEPRRKDALYPLHRMRAQLSDGMQEPAKQILTQNAFVDYLPLRVVVTDIEQEKITVQLADETQDRLLNLQKYPFDRVLLVGLTNTEATALVRRMRLSTDIIQVEPLSMFVQEYVLKIGTDAPGIISKIGGRLRGVSLSAYRAWKKLD